jgi:hypothetical protein
VSRLSTSSSDARVRSGLRFGVAVIALLAMTEMALRVPAVRRLLPPRTHFYQTSIARLLDELDSVTSMAGRIDVLFIGSSVVFSDIDPLLFDAVARPDLPKLVSFNAGIAGMWPAGVYLYLKHVWLPTAQPRVVVQGIRYMELAAQTAAKEHDQIWSGRVEPAWRDADLSTWLRATLVSHSALLQYRSVLLRTLQPFVHGTPGAEEDVRLRGFRPRPRTTVPLRDVEGEPPNTTTCDTTDGCAMGFRALHDTIAAVRQSGASYVLVNIPEHAQRWRIEGGEDRYRAYLAAVKTFAAAEQVPFVDITNENAAAWADTVYFGDTSHMTAGGARRFTRELSSAMAPVLRATLGASKPEQTRVSLE